MSAFYKTQNYYEQGRLIDLMFFSSDQSIWQYLNESIKAVSVLCLILVIALIGGYITAKTPEKKNEVSRLIFIGSIVVALAVFSSLLIYPMVLKNLKSDSVITGQTQGEQKNGQGNAHQQYTSSTSKEDCWLCGNGSNGRLQCYWGEDNVAVIDLNTFDFVKFDINRYSSDKTLIKQKFGFMEIMSRSFQNGENLFIHTNPDRGYAEGTISLDGNSKLSIDDLSSHLCSDCLNELMGKYTDGSKHWNLAILDFNDKTLTPLEESVTGFEIGDFSVRCHYQKDTNKIDLLVWYSPLRYQ